MWCVRQVIAVVNLIMHKKGTNMFWIKHHYPVWYIYIYIFSLKVKNPYIVFQTAWDICINITYKHRDFIKLPVMVIKTDIEYHCSDAVQESHHTNKDKELGGCWVVSIRMSVELCSITLSKFKMGILQSEIHFFDDNKKRKVTKQIVSPALCIIYRKYVQFITAIALYLVAFFYCCCCVPAISKTLNSLWK